MSTIIEESKQNFKIGDKVRFTDLGIERIGVIRAINFDHYRIEYKTPNKQFLNFKTSCWIYKGNIHGKK
jgi:hypothetical protein